jgi:DnaJ-class molecular chaperone
VLGRAKPDHKCPTCKGEGKVDRPTAAGVVKVTCPSCRGSGKGRGVVTK